MRLFLTLALLFFFGSQCPAAQYDTEHHQDGSLSYKIKLNRDGKRHGKYTMYYPSGKAKKKGKKKEVGVYKKGKLHGVRSMADKKGTLISEELYWQGRLLYPMSQRFLLQQFKLLKEEAWKTVAATGKPSNEGAVSPEIFAGVLARVNSYRLLSGLPTDVGYDDSYNHFAQEAAELLVAVKKLTHHPKNPGLPEKEFTDGYEGTTHGNLFQGRNGPTTIDGYMDDSDNTNRDRVGHRRWILWKDLANIGHGDSGDFSCLYVIGTAKSPKIEIPYTAFPPRGFIPLSMFGTHYAWHVSPQKEWYSVDKNAKLNAYHVNPKTFEKMGPAIPMKFRNVDGAGIGYSPAIISQPDKLSLKKGDSFIIEVTGVKKLRKDAPDLTFLVTFF